MPKCISDLVQCLILKRVLVQVFKHCNLLLQYKLITAIYFLHLQLQKSGKFNCSSCSKYFKTTGGLRRHQRRCWKSEAQLKEDTTQQIFQETISDVLADDCYPDEIKTGLKTFIPYENQIRIIIWRNTTNLWKVLQKFKFWSILHVILFKYLRMFRKVCLITPPIMCYCGRTFGEKLLAHFRRKQNEVVFNDPTNIK